MGFLLVSLCSLTSLISVNIFLDVQLNVGPPIILGELLHLVSPRMSHGDAIVMMSSQSHGLFGM
jgi:hypothetical protein